MFSFKSHTLLCFSFLSLPLFAQQADTRKYHIVEPMEYFFSISKRYNVPINDLARWNNMSLEDVIPVGKKLYIEPPVQGKGEAAPVEYSRNAKGVPANTRIQSPGKYQKQQGNIHTVQALETIEGIARLYGLTPAALREMNKLHELEVVPAGTRLKTKKSF